MHRKSVGTADRTALDILADKGGALDELEVQRVKDLALQSEELELRDFRRSLIFVKCSQRQWTRKQAAARMGGHCQLEAVIGRVAG